MENNSKESLEYFNEGYSSFKLLANDENQLIFERISIVRYKYLPMAFIVVAVAIILFGLRYGWFFAAFVTIVMSISVSFYWTTKPIKIIAKKGSLTFVYKQLFLFLRAKQFVADNISAIQAKPYSKMNVRAFAQVNLILKSGEIYPIYQGLRSERSIAEQDSEKLCRALSERIGVALDIKQCVP